MKNTDNHISLLGWAQDDDKSEAAVVDRLEIDRSKWIPKIELQGTSKLIIILVACLARNLLCSSDEGCHHIFEVDFRMSFFFIFFIL